MKKVCVFGLGYIGLPTACLLATHGHQVIGVDLKADIVQKINAGKAPFEEPGLEELFGQAIDLDNFHATSNVEPADVFLIAVPTPLDKEIRMAGLQAVRQATEAIASVLKKGDLVILESTVPPRTCEKLLLSILEGSGLKCNDDFHLVHCPERAIPGNTIHEMVHNDRVIGGMSRKSAEIAKELYSSFVKGEIHATDVSTAEMVKLMENTFRDINIALANEFAQIADESNVNVWEAIELANKHPRVNILKPGPGVGGHCLAVDPWFLTNGSKSSRIIALAREINDSMPHHVLNLIKKMVPATTGTNIAVLGVAYKANVGDTRESPAIKVIRLLENEGYRVRSHDPFVREFEYPLYSFNEALRDSDCIVHMTDHTSFEGIDPSAVSSATRTRNLIDTRNTLDQTKWLKAGFTVRVLGCGSHQG